MRMDQIYATSGRVQTDDLDWEAAGRVGLTDGEAFALAYFADIEGQTVYYLRDLLSSRLARDPDVLGFLSVWNYEEYFHGQALARLLEACGRPLELGRGEAIRRSARWAERLEAIGTWVGSRLFRGAFPALYMAWGAAQELSTLRGYEALEAGTKNPVLAELCRRIARQERRHFAWYYHSARVRLETSQAARRLTRFALALFWAPVGAAVKGPEGAARLVEFLFPGEVGAAVSADIDRRIGALPGLAGVRMVRGFVERCTEGAPSEACAAKRDLRRGRAGVGRRWPVALGFGLAHGFGFAGALAELGLPRAGLATALVSFNLGVELGQAAVVAFLVPLLALAARVPVLARRGLPVGSAALGGAGLFWLVERIPW